MVPQREGHGRDRRRNQPHHRGDQVIQKYLI